MMFSLLVFLSLVNIIISVPSPGRANVCSESTTVIHSRVVSYAVSHQTTGSTSCGFLSWERCSTYGRGYTLAHRIEYYDVYSTNYFCCSGWAEDGLGGCTIPICPPHDCGVGGTCVDPDTCECSSGFQGTQCLAVCQPQCQNNGQCTGPNNCVCPEGYYGSRCQNDVDECSVGVDGCGQICSNSMGSFSCDCNDGWTLDPDKKNCTAIPCVEIGVPFYGNRTCSGFTTGETCTFECEWNYRLIGSDMRECLPNGVWSGSTTRCEEILCAEIPSPLNGYILSPCENQVGSECSFGCDSGYFLEENIVTECLLSGIWNSNFPTCIDSSITQLPKDESPKEDNSNLPYLVGGVCGGCVVFILLSIFIIRRKAKTYRGAKDMQRQWPI